MSAVKMSSKLKILMLLISMVFLLYCFICSLSILTISFRLLCSNVSGSILTNANLQNPILGLMMGVLATSIIHSSSATTSLVVALAASGVISLREGIPVIMGTNVGTSLTSTLVSLSNIKKVDEYELGFSVAVIHDIFNWLTIMVMLPLEIGTGLLETISGQIVKNANIQKNVPHSGALLFYNVLFEPIISTLVILEDEAIVSSMRVNKTLESEYDSLESMEDYSSESGHRSELGEQLEETSDVTFSILKTKCIDGCKYLFAETGLSDEAIGGILLVVSFFFFIASYIFLVRTMKSILSIPLAGVSINFLSKDLPFVPWLTGYIFILIGAMITVLIQSSSILTSALVPLVSNKIITLERAYPITLGANLGTTTTSLLAALSFGMEENSFRLALCHLFFNLFGIAFFFPLGIMRWPLFIAKKFGSKVLNFLIDSFFFPGPLVIYGLSLVNIILFYIIAVSFVVGLIFVTLVNFLQEPKPQMFP